MEETLQQGGNGEELSATTAPDDNVGIQVTGDIVHFQKYAKFLPDLHRRETWLETSSRNMRMHQKKYPFLREKIEEVYKNFVFNKKVLPSMRSMQFSGKPIEINNSRIYNCAYLPVNSWEAFPEIMFLLLGGTGCGYSVQRHHISQLPSIRKPTRRRKFVVSDDIIGWADAVKALVRAYLDGKFLPEFNFTGIRSKGALLKTSGGKAPGPEPLKTALKEIQNIFESKENGQKLTTLDAHDICCHIADAVLSGGIRRAAMISLFSLDDNLMMNSKGNFEVDLIDEQQINGGSTFEVKVCCRGETHNLFLPKNQLENLQQTKTLPWWHFQPQRGRANNSVVFVRYKATKEVFNRFWDKVKENKSGEPGIYFTNSAEWGTNPCVEAGLRAFQFCNLCEVNASTIKDQSDLEECTIAAVFIGTLQAGYTDLHYLRDCWKETTERDALLGVGLTGLAGVDITALNWKKAVEQAELLNIEIAQRLRIKPAARITVIKPSGTASLVLGCSSGIHAWHAEYYIRRITINKQESIYNYLIEAMPELMEDWKMNAERDAFLCIPMKAPSGSVLRKDESALEFLDRVRYMSDNWIKPGHVRGDNTHNISATVTMKDSEWDEVGEWMWENRNHFNGLAVLPEDLGTYEQTPFEEITKEKYLELVPFLKNIDLTKVRELEDTTTQALEPACAGGSCELN